VRGYFFPLSGLICLGVSAGLPLRSSPFERILRGDHPEDAMDRATERSHRRVKIIVLRITEVEENGLILAAFDFASYSNAIHRLEPGDRLLLYTDGIVEASNAAGTFLGQDALCELLRKTAGLSSSAAADSIISFVRHWSAKQDDDLTVLICDYVSA
jgi:serine/threonine protein phosphatase PrpC